MENNSVLEFFNQNMDLITDYFWECYRELKSPNYSEMLRKYLSGTTKDGVYFDSIKVKRSELTQYLRELYKDWLTNERCKS